MKMPIIVLLVAATLSSFFTISKAELTLNGYNDGCLNLQNTTTNITCTGFNVKETVSWTVTWNQGGGLAFQGACNYNVTIPDACSPIGQYFNISLNQYGNVSEITIDPSNGSDYTVNCSATNQTAIYSTHNSTCMTAAQNTTPTVTHSQRITSTTSSTTATSTTPSSTTTSSSSTTTTTQATLTPTTAAADTNLMTTSTTAQPTTSLRKGGESSITETTRITSPTSDTPDNSSTKATTLNQTSETVATTKGPRFLDKTEVAAIAGGVAAFVALLVVLIVVVVVCKRRRKQKKYTATHRKRVTRGSSAGKKQTPENEEGHAYANIDMGERSGELATERDGTVEPETKMYTTAQQIGGDRKKSAKPLTSVAHSFPKSTADHMTDHVSKEPYNTLSFSPRRPSLEDVEEDYSHVTSQLADDLEYNTLRYDVSRENPSYTVEDDYNHI